MRKMKDSGIPWLGRVPTKWEKSRLKSIAILSPTVDVSHVPLDDEVTFLPMECVKQGAYIPNTAPITNLNASYCLFSQGDIVIAKVTPCFENGNIARADGLLHGVGFGSSELFVLRQKKNTCRDFLFWLLQAEPFRSKAIASMTGAGGLKRVSGDAVKNYWFFCPALKMQQRIADYLDAKCAKIDETVKRQKTVIEKLKAYKQSVITEAVTKGLNPNAPMKESGIEWIGKIPEDAKTSRVGVFYQSILGKMVAPTQRDPRESIEKYLCALNVHFDGIDLSTVKQMWFTPEEKIQYELRKGDLLVVEGGAGAGGAFVFNIDSIEKYYIQNSIHLIRPISKTTNQYLFYWLYSLVSRKYIEVISNQATIPHFTKEKLLATPIVVFTLPEQLKIVDYLDKKCAAIDTAIAKKEALIEKLVAYKKSLIYECVTGKREV